MRAWVLVGLVVASTVMGDLLQSLEMKRHGEIHDFHPRGWARLFGALARKRFLILGVGFMAVSFFAASLTHTLLCALTFCPSACLYGHARLVHGLNLQDVCRCVNVQPSLVQSAPLRQGGADGCL